MFYRLPIFFSSCFYFSLLLIKGLYLSLLFKNQHSDNLIFTISSEAVYCLTTAFFMLILSCFFFYQNKIFRYTQQNKKNTFFLAIFSALLFFVLELILTNIMITYVLPTLSNQMSHMGISHYEMLSISGMFYGILSLVAYSWGLPILAVILYFMIKWSRSFFICDLVTSEPSLQENTEKQNYVLELESNRIVSDDMPRKVTDDDYRKLYAIIFSATFCAVAHGVIWNIYFKIFTSIPELDFVFEDYYPVIFIAAFLFIAVNYFYLLNITQKFIIRTYQWIPTSSLLTAVAITLVLFAITVALVNAFSMIFISPLNGGALMIGLVILFVINYIILYWLSRFALRRYFA